MEKFQQANQKICLQLIEITQQQFNNLYQCIQLIDQGSYGVVFKCFNNNTDQFVACKYIIGQNGFQSFLRQQHLMKQVNHENVLNYIGIYDNITKNQKMVVTPYCHKLNLLKCLPELKTKNQQFKIWVCVQIARGINAIHQKNIIHRDVKPQNILITKNWEVKLCDFGIGRLDNDLTKSKKIGTPLYRDPNVPSGNYTKKCDIYSMGLVFDTIFRGKSILEATSQQSLLLQLQYFKEHKKEMINSNLCCNQMKQIIIDCLEGEQSRRPHSSFLLNKLENLWGSFGSSNSQEIEQFNIMDDLEKQANPKQESLQTESEQLILPNGGQNNRQFQFCKIEKTASFQIFETQEQLLKTDNSNFTNIIIKLAKIDKKYNEQIQKNTKSLQICKFFQEKKQIVTQLKYLFKVPNIAPHDKKIIAFIALFGYLRFLIIHKMFLSNQPNSKITDIQGISLQDISDKTKEICLNFIEVQQKLIKKKIYPLLTDIWNHKHLYGESLTSNIIQMIKNAKECQFQNIQDYQSTLIQSEYEKILRSQRYARIKMGLQSIWGKLKAVQSFF